MSKTEKGGKLLEPRDQLDIAIIKLYANEKILFYKQKTCDENLRRLCDKNETVFHLGLRAGEQHSHK